MQMLLYSAISEFLEDRATQRATKALDDIINMRPDHANLVIDEATDEIEIVNVNELMFHQSLHECHRFN